MAEATEARRLLAEAGADFLCIRSVELTSGQGTSERSVAGGFTNAKGCKLS